MSTYDKYGFEFILSAGINYSGPTINSNYVSISDDLKFKFPERLHKQQRTRCNCECS